jgi:hypothetical protein
LLPPNSAKKSFLPLDREVYPPEAGRGGGETRAWLSSVVNQWSAVVNVFAAVVGPWSMVVNVFTAVVGPWSVVVNVFAAVGGP